MYQYKATVVRWVDGDTVYLNVDLGFNISVKECFRVLDLDTPERSKDGYLEAIEISRDVMPIGSQHTIETLKKDKYGIWLVRLPVLLEAMAAAGLIDIHPWLKPGGS